MIAWLVELLAAALRHKGILLDSVLEKAMEGK
jgi:hypothetical protein